MQDGSHVRPIVLAGLTAWPNIPSLTPPIPQPNSEVRPAKCNGTRSNSKRLCKLLSKFTDSNLFVKYNSFKNDGLSKTLVYLDSMLKPPNLHFFLSQHQSISSIVSLPPPFIHRLLLCSSRLPYREAAQRAEAQRRASGAQTSVVTMVQRHPRVDESSHACHASRYMC